MVTVVDGHQVGLFMPFSGCCFELVCLYECFSTVVQHDADGFGWLLDYVGNDVAGQACNVVEQGGESEIYVVAESLTAAFSEAFVEGEWLFLVFGPFEGCYCHFPCHCFVFGDPVTHGIYIVQKLNGCGVGVLHGVSYIGLIMSCFKV